MKKGMKTKEIINRISIELFVKQGITETTIRQIADQANIAEGTIYRHYKSKEDLAYQLFYKNYISFTYDLQKIEKENKTLYLKLSSMIKHFCRTYDKNPILFNYLLISQHNQLKNIKKDIQTPVTLLTKICEKGITKGEIPTQDVNICVATILGIILQTATFKTYKRIKDSMLSISNNIINNCWCAINN